MSRFDRAVWLLVVTPPLVLGLAAFLFGIGLPQAEKRFWPNPDTNLAEAAALGDVARIRALTVRGGSLHVLLPVRSGLVREGPGSMTPLEAAIRNRSDAAIAVLWELGGPPPRDEAARELWCLANQVGANSAAALLDQVLQSPRECDGRPAQPVQSAR